MKKRIEDLALFGGPALFRRPRSTSSLVRPDFQVFLGYMKTTYDAGQFTNNGPNVRELERRLAAFHETRHCIAFCSGFWALVMTIRALALTGRDEILMPSLTYRRMADIAAWVPLKPRFCEVDPDTLALTRETVEPCLSDRTALIMAVHPIVNCCDVGGISALATERGAPLIFDSVESVFESLPDGKIGQFGNAECFSMHASKLINGFEGGYVTTNDDDLASKLKSQRTFGFAGKDSIDEPGGINAKLCEAHAAMALANLDCLDETVSDNRDRYRVYQRRLAEIPGLRLLEFDECQATSFKNIIAEVTPEWSVSRDATVRIMNAENILARAYYDPPLHRKPMKYPHVPAVLETTDGLAKRFISLPCGAHVSTDDIERVADFLSFLSKAGEEISARLGKELDVAGV